MTWPPPADTSPRLVLDFNEPMRPKARAYVKIIPGGGKPPIGSTLAFQNRRKLYELTPAERGDKT